MLFPLGATEHLSDAGDQEVLCGDELASACEAAGVTTHLIGGADVAAELDAKRAINQGARLAIAL